MIKKFLLLPFCALLFSCHQPTHTDTLPTLDQVAEQYVRLGLTIGLYDPDFVDAYYGPDSLKPGMPKSAFFPKDSLFKAADSLIHNLQPYLNAERNDSNATRAGWINDQLVAFKRRIRIVAGDTAGFDEEAKDLFGVQPPSYDENYFKNIVSRLDSTLPGKGTIANRFQVMAQRFIIPVQKLDTVFKTAINESRKRTLAFYKLPETENFSLEFVTGKSWSGYNWYKGNFSSLIQINTDISIFIERAIDVASHESYPGHHVYNMLLEKNLYRDKGYVEISLYPLFSPQSLIAEGSANYGIEMAFPGKEKNKLAKEILLPLAGLDTTGLDSYFDALQLKGQLNFVRNEVARAVINKTMDEKEAMRWLMEYGLNNEETARKSLSFINKYRSYVINYNYGKQLVKEYIESANKTNGTANSEWKLFEQLLSSQVRVGELQKKS